MEIWCRALELASRGTERNRVGTALKVLLGLVSGFASCIRELGRVAAPSHLRAAHTTTRLNLDVGDVKRGGHASQNAEPDPSTE